MTFGSGVSDIDPIYLPSGQVPLSNPSFALRTGADDPASLSAWFAELEAERRAARVKIADEERWIAALLPLARGDAPVVAAATSAGTLTGVLLMTTSNAKLAALAKQGAKKEQIVKTSLAYGVMSRHTAFLVLESEAAYKRWGIERKQELLRREQAKSP